MTHEREHDTANEMARLFLENLAEELRTQDNASTAWPIFLVQKRVMVTGLEFAHADELRLEDAGFVGIAWRWEYESAHLTRRSAEDYIRANAHRHRHGLQVYVDSQRRVPEWRTLLTILERIER